MKGIRTATTTLAPAAAAISAVATLACCLPWGLGAAFGGAGIERICRPIPSRIHRSVGHLAWNRARSNRTLEAKLPASQWNRDRCLGNCRRGCSCGRPVP